MSLLMILSRNSFLYPRVYGSFRVNKVVKSKLSLKIGHFIDSFAFWSRFGCSGESKTLDEASNWWDNYHTNRRAWRADSEKRSRAYEDWQRQRGPTKAWWRTSCQRQVRKQRQPSPHRFHATGSTRKSNDFRKSRGQTIRRSQHSTCWHWMKPSSDLVPCWLPLREDQPGRPKCTASFPSRPRCIPYMTSSPNVTSQKVYILN